MKTNLVQLDSKGPHSQHKLWVRKKQHGGKIYGAPTCSGSCSCYSPVLASAPPAVAAVSELSAFLDNDTVICFDDDFNILH